MSDVTKEQILEIVATTFLHREDKIAANAARQAVERVVEHLQHLGVLDESGFAKPGQRLKIRVVDPRCYPPLVLN